MIFYDSDNYQFAHRSLLPNLLQECSHDQQIPQFFQQIPENNNNYNNSNNRNSQSNSNTNNSNQNHSTSQNYSETTVFYPFGIVRNNYTKIHKKPLSKKRGPYRKYTILDKEDVIRQISDEISIKEISKNYGIDCKTIKRWKEKGAERQPGGGRKVQDKIMEDELFEALKQELAAKKCKIEKKVITRLARRLSNIEGFKASKGWYAKFNYRTKFEQYQANYLRNNQQG